MKKWFRMCTRPGLSTCRFNTVATHGADNTNKELLACFRPDADDECEEICKTGTVKSRPTGTTWTHQSSVTIQGRERRLDRKEINVYVPQNPFRNGSLMQRARGILNAVSGTTQSGTKDTKRYVHQQKRMIEGSQLIQRNCLQLQTRSKQNQRGKG